MQTMKSNELKYQMALHAIVLVWGFTGILGKLISLDAYSIVWYRMLIAFAGLLIYAKVIRLPIMVDPLTLGKYLGVGFIVATHWILFFESIKVSTVSVALATMSSATLFTAILEPLFYRRKIIGYEMLFGVLVIAGLVMIFNFESSYYQGISLALLSAFCASLFTTINGKFIGNGEKSRVISLYEMLGGVIGITLYFVLTGELGIWESLPSGADLGYLLILGLVCTSLAFVISVEVMKHLSPYTVSISINMEPVYSIILALLFFGEEERMSPGFYAGALLILSTILVNAYLKRRQRRQALKMNA
jgi:drug/metabolite transporter (DMT)-like permease